MTTNTTRDATPGPTPPSGASMVPRGWRTATVVLSVVLALLVLCAVVGGMWMYGQINLRAIYANNAYPPPVTGIPTSTDHAVRGSAEALTMAASVVPLLVAGYDQPTAVGAHLHDARDDVWDAAWSFGQCVESTVREAGDVEAAWSQCVAQRTRSGQRDLLDMGPNSGLTDRDRVRLYLSIAGVGESLVASFRASHPFTLDTAALPQVFRRPLREAVDNAVTLLNNDPAPPPGARVRATLPALALSGGAGNGAFTAGYIDAMLRVREEVVYCAQHPGTAGCPVGAASPDALTRLGEVERFGTVTGTSVGSLVAMLLDGYYGSEDPVGGGASCPWPDGSVPPEAGLDRVRAGGTPQRCALAGLWKDFNQSGESDLLCVRQGTALQIVTPSPMGKALDSLLEFDPLRSHMNAYLAGEMTRRVASNNFLRVAMATDLQQNVVVGLDERACNALFPWNTSPDALRECLATNLTASFVLPMYVSPQPRVYAGLHTRCGDRESCACGEYGTWFDGGLRSGLPSLRALQLTALVPRAGERDEEGTGRVVAISTGRESGTPELPEQLQTGFQILAATPPAMDYQIRALELMAAQTYAAQQRERFCVVATNLRVSGEVACPGASRRSGGGAMGSSVGFNADSNALLAASGSGTPGQCGSVFPVFVPAQVPDAVVAAGYTFDPEVLRGLFAWGQLAFLAAFYDLHDAADTGPSSPASADLPCTPLRQPCYSVLDHLHWDVTRDQGRALASLPTSGVSQMCRTARTRARALSAEIQDRDGWQRHITARREALLRDTHECPTTVAAAACHGDPMDAGGGR